MRIVVFIAAQIEACVVVELIEWRRLSQTTIRSLSRFDADLFAKGQLGRQFQDSYDRK